MLFLIKNEGFVKLSKKKTVLWSFIKMYFRRRPPVGHRRAFGDPKNPENLKVQKFNSSKSSRSQSSKMKNQKIIISSHRLIDNQGLIKYRF